ncbi:hypothetical protein NBRC116188_18770 [Oceaniserpentilla sp. 4NH20-0058]|uniref:hypothetical protein n=1 Tax=Oceaniserpentilla sp. 4NH20-0058 TaxID=3127660 RepID=UPI00310BA898
MKTVLASLILTLAAYAQACCADDLQVSLFSSQTILSEYSEHTVQPTWLFGHSGSPQLMGFTQVSNTFLQNSRQAHTVQYMGFGLHQQVTPFFYTQLLMSEKSGGASEVKIGLDF